MRSWLLAAFLCLALLATGFAAVDLSGTWALDLKASDSPDPMTKRLGVSGLQRGLMDSVKLVSAYTQTADELTVVSHATGFSRTEQFPLRVTRRLGDGGQTLVLTQTLEVAGESPVVIHRIWRKQSGSR